MSSKAGQIRCMGAHPIYYIKVLGWLLNTGTNFNFSLNYVPTKINTKLQIDPITLEGLVLESASCLSRNLVAS